MCFLMFFFFFSGGVLEGNSPSFDCRLVPGVASLACKRVSSDVARFLGGARKTATSKWLKGKN